MFFYVAFVSMNNQSEELCVTALVLQLHVRPFHLLQPMTKSAAFFYFVLFFFILLYFY